MTYFVSDIARIIHASHSELKDGPISLLLTDSRSLSFPEETLFFALKTKQNDGHKYVTELYQKGVRNFVISQQLPIFGTLPEANLLQVNDTLSALQQLAAAHRKHFSIPVIGITGSNGKTIVKEWLYQLLNEDKRIVRSPRSYNSQTGVPLSVWRLDEQAELAIFEAGISLPEEMERLEKIILPHVGILTNIGSAHQSAEAPRTAALVAAVMHEDGGLRAREDLRHDVPEQRVHQPRVPVGRYEDEVATLFLRHLQDAVGGGFPGEVHLLALHAVLRAHLLRDIEALLADAAYAEAWWHAEALLAAAEADVDAPVVNFDLCAAHAADGVDEYELPVLLRDSAQILEGVDEAGAGLVVGDGDSLDLWVAAQCIGFAVLLFIVGMFLESNAAYIMLVPLLHPIAIQYGIDPLHFGFLFVLNLVIGMLTPPVGVVLFVVSGVTGGRMRELVANAWPFIALMYGVLVLCMLFPPLVTSLPRALGY